VALVGALAIITTLGVGSAEAAKKGPQASAGLTTVCSLDVDVDGPDGANVDVTLVVRDQSSGGETPAVTEWEITGLAKVNKGNWKGGGADGNQPVFDTAGEEAPNAGLPLLVDQEFPNSVNIGPVPLTLCVEMAGTGNGNGDCEAGEVCEINPEVANAKALNVMSTVTTASDPVSLAEAEVVGDFLGDEDGICEALTDPTEVCVGDQDEICDVGETCVVNEPTRTVMNMCGDDLATGVIEPMGIPLSQDDIDDITDACANLVP
jgi:hypothetical protein